MVKRFLKEESGQSMIEYGLIIALVMVVLMGALVFMNGGFTSLYNKISTTVNSASGN